MTGTILGAMAPRPRGPTRNAGNPVGDFADFLRWKLDTEFRRSPDEDLQDIRERFVKALVKHGCKISSEGVRKWEQGINFPDPRRLNQVGKALGYSDWFSLVAAIRVFRGK